ncbi:MAG: helix-hairpin-helix domain-containing protein [Prevotella sp.]|nr:helix-hairpin-helix domain-containing protein [Prevotella sp.]
MEKPWKSHYNRSDRKSFAALVLVIAATVAALVFMGNGNIGALCFGPGKNISAGDSLEFSRYHADNRGERGYGKYTGTGRNVRLHRQNEPYYAADECKTELFYFDPNTADSTALLRLGLQPWQVRNIYKYRARGGIYRKPSDFARLYGLTAGRYKALEPYIRISSDYKSASVFAEAEHDKRDSLKYPVKIGDSERIVLNTADTTQLKRVPGIGSGFARAIVAFRERLGGYVSIDQLDEIDDFPLDAKHFFVLGDSKPRKIDVNTCTLAQMKRHPYMGFFRAKAIVDYRRIHGALTNIDELALHRDFPGEAIKRLKPYLEY